MRCRDYLGILIGAVALFMSSECDAAEAWGLQRGSVELKSAGPLAFGPDGILFVGDPTAAEIVAIATEDSSGDSAGTNLQIADFQQTLANALNAPVDQVRVVDMAVNQASGNVYLSVAYGQPVQAALMRITHDGTVRQLPLDDVRHSRAKLTGAPESRPPQGRRADPRDESITDLAFIEGKVFVSGLTNAQSPSAVRALPFPFADIHLGTSIEIYHAAHGRLEDSAPVRTFAPLVIDGQPILLAGFTCTPLVKFPIGDLTPGEKVRGTTVAELGNRNRPLDMIVYRKGDEDFVLMSNSARGVMKISTDRIRENAGLHEPVPNGGTAGQPHEVISSLQGIEQLDRLDDHRAIVLAKSGDTCELRTIELP